MGGFLLARSSETDPSALKRALGVFASKGLSLNRRVDFSDFTLYVFFKKFHPVENYAEIDGGDFVCATGTFFYNGESGPSALRALHADFEVPGSLDHLPMGEYAVIIKKGEDVGLFVSPSGLYRVYGTDDGNQVSTSFLALRRAMGDVQLSPQEFYEYILNGAAYGGPTILRGIHGLQCRRWFSIPGMGATTMAGREFTDLARMGFSGAVEKVGQDLLHYFGFIARNFGDEVCSALSGGYDSRLILGLLRRHRIAPYLYVYGSEDAADVRVAEAIAKGEDLPLHRTDRVTTRVPAPDQYREIVRDNFLFTDGLANEGVFDPGPNLANRRARVARARLQLNGGGGEIYRNFWVLPDRPFSTKQFLTSKYDRFDYGPLGNRFDKNEYFNVLAEKVRNCAGADTHTLNRSQIERLYADFRLQFWMGTNNSSNAQYADTLTPFGEYVFTQDSFTIPLSWKNDGRFEAELIRMMDPRLASYPSCYGHDFASPLTWKRRVTGTLMRNVPVSVRPFLRRKVSPKSRVSALRRPEYLGDDHLRALGLSGDLAVDEFVDRGRIRSTEILRRILTVELLLQDDL